MLNIKQETINLLKIHIKDNICDSSKDFLYLTHKVQSINTKQINWTSSNFKMFCYAKGPVKKMKYKAQTERI